MASNPVSAYLGHLPAILRQGPFLGRFLLAFEAILSGKAPSEPGVSPPEGIEELLDRIHTFLDPDTAPADFLPWLAQWVSASLRDNWSEQTKRAFLSQIVRLYQLRGTPRGVEEMVKLCVTADVQIIEWRRRVYGYPIGFVIGALPSINAGFDWSKPHHHFLVVVTANEQDPVTVARLVRQVQAIVDREKPAHCYYGLLLRYPALRINNDPAGAPAQGPGVIVGQNTVLGTITAP